MSYWIKVFLCTILPAILLYFIAWPYYDQSDDAYNTFKHLFFQVSVFLLPTSLIVMNYFFARNQNPYTFIVNTAIILISVAIYVERLGLLYRTSFRWISPPGFHERVTFFENSSIISMVVALLIVQLYMILRKRIKFS